MVVLLFSEEETMENPLKNLYRSKSVYVSLPSRGRYYKSGVDLSIDDELGIMPMTAVDEIKLKSPDALFNGDALFELLKSCCPDIKNPQETPACDVDVIMMAIKIATHGDKLEVSSKCPSCKKENEYELPLTPIMASSKEIPIENVIKLKDNIKVFVRPFSLHSQIKGNIQKFHTMRMQMLLNENMSNKEKSDLFNDALVSASLVSVQLVSDNIIKVELPQENGETTVVESQDHILEWVENMDSKTYDVVISKIRELSNPGLETNINITCANCDHEYKTNLELDPVSFFT